MGCELFVFNSNLIGVVIPKIKSLLIICILIVSGCEYLGFDSKYECGTTQSECYEGAVFICDEECIDSYYGVLYQIQAKSAEAAEGECTKKIGGYDWADKCGLSCICHEKKGIFN